MRFDETLPKQLPKSCFFVLASEAGFEGERPSIFTRVSPHKGMNGSLVMRDVSGRFVTGSRHIHSVETRKKISAANKGKKGHTWTIQEKERASLLRKGQKLTEEHKNNISVSLKGMRKSEEHKMKMRLAQIGIKRGKFTDEHKKKIGRSGESHWHWKGGGGTTGYDRRKREQQAGRPRSDNCEICGIPASELRQALHFDHDHKTGKFRGWICNRCNLALGMVSDNVEILRRMVDYLENIQINDWQLNYR